MEKTPVFSFDRAKGDIGILGGTFDPIHHGHLYAARLALTRCGLARVVLMPADMPPHKRPEGMTPIADRWEMVCRAVRGVPGLSVSDYELHNAGRDYTVDTMAALQAVIPAGCRLHFIIGADSLISLEHWHEYERLLSLVPMIVVYRPGHGDDEITGMAQKLRQEHPGADIRLLPCEGLDISSTQVRLRVRAGQPIDALVPPEVAAYIHEKGLYRG